MSRDYITEWAQSFLDAGRDPATVRVDLAAGPVTDAVAARMEEIGGEAA